jgi:hypothetical protein
MSALVGTARDLNVVATSVALIPSRSVDAERTKTGAPPFVYGGAPVLIQWDVAAAAFSARV